MQWVNCEGTVRRKSADVTGEMCSCGCLTYLAVMPTFDFHVKSAITLVTADLIYNFAVSALPLLGDFRGSRQGSILHTPAGSARHGPTIAFHV